MYDISNFGRNVWPTSGLSNWRPAGRVDPARQAKLDFYNIVEMFNAVINAYSCS